MGIAVEPYTETRIAAVRQFNLRLAAGGASDEFRFPERPATGPRPADGRRRVFPEYFLAVENGAVRGGFILNSRLFSFGADIRLVAHYRLPLSEGIVNQAYAGVGLQMLRSALKARPLLFALGMGGAGHPLPRMLKALGWSLFAVPFYFKVNGPQRFLRGIRALRSTPAGRTLLDLAAATGAGALAIRALQGLKTRRGRCGAFSAEPVEEFGPWSDELWERCRSHYAMIAVRDSETLGLLYPAGDPRFIRLKVTRAGAPAGWAVLLDTPMRGHKQFGDLRVGSIADCLAAPEDAGAVISAAAETLANRGVDLIVSNQSHDAWCAALDRAGFLRGPSNFLFAASKQLSHLLAPFERKKWVIHLNRGDGDGPIHL